MIKRLVLAVALIIAASASAWSQAGLMKPHTVKCNPTGSQANAQDCANPVIAGVSINPTAATTNQGFNITQSGPTSGNQNAQIDFNSINVTAEAINTGSTSNTVNAFSSQLTFGGSNAAGARQAGFFQTIQTAPTSATNPNRNYVGLVGVCTGSSGDGGTGLTTGTAQGACFGGNFVAQSSGTNLLAVTGLENDVALPSGGSAVYRFGYSAVSSAGAQGAIIDAAYEVGAAGGAGSTGWKNAFIMANANGIAPLSTSGCVICTDGTANTIATGIDLSAYTITGNIFNSSSFRVTGSGVFSRYTAVGGAPSVGSCTGLGASGTCAFVAGSQDNAGQVTLSPAGAGLAGTGALTITYSGSLGTHGSACTFTTGNGTGGWTAPTSFNAGATSVNSFTVTWTGGAALTAGSTYLINYICMGF